MVIFLHRYIPNMKRLSLVGISALALLSVRFLPAQTAYSLAPVEFGMELRTPDGRPALQYVTRKPTEPNLQSASVGFLYPILTPKGVPAVELAPQDHRHHRGVFLAWHSMTTPVSRADFWGWGEWAPVENRVIRSEGMQLVETDEKHALLEAHNEWMAGRTKYLDETVRVRVEEQRGAYLIDLEYRLIPALEITLDQTAFGGFCVRARQGSNPNCSRSFRLSHPGGAPPLETGDHLARAAVVRLCSGPGRRPPGQPCGHGPPQQSPNGVVHQHQGGHDQPRHRCSRPNPPPGGQALPATVPPHCQR